MPDKVSDSLVVHMLNRNYVHVLRITPRAGTWHMPNKLNESRNMDQITVICMGTKRCELFYEFLSFLAKETTWKTIWDSFI